VDREKVPDVLRNFDFANPDLSIPQRSETTVPQQALFVMNHPFVADRAIALTRTLPKADATTRVNQLYARLYQRQPTPAELATSLAFVQADSAPLAQRTTSRAWSYGIGEFDRGTGHVKGFTALPYFNGTAWQGGNLWPDRKLGWAQLTPTGGHPGNDRQHAVVRRWTAPEDGDYTLDSTLIHEPEAGDGIRAFVGHSTRGLLRSTAIHHSTERIDVDSITMRRGESIDFIVDIRDGLNSDQFLWSPMIALTGTTGAGGDSAGQTWNAEKDFTGDSTTPLDAWQQLAQVLMLANEFLFVD
jgi:hypothetical protein